MSSTPNIDFLTNELARLGLDTKGNKAALEKRLKRAKKRVINDLLVAESLQLANERQAIIDAKPQPFDYYLICDVEATCLDNSGFDYENEIIEFPVILVQSDPLKIVSTFHKYVKPTIHPILSPFCTLLTGISQEVVENSQTWQIVYQDFLDWLDVNAVDRNQCLFVSDGPWDVRDFIGKELNYHEISRPSFMHRILDIRKHYAKKYDRQSTNLNGMLLGLNMEFEGREHSGLDDAKNVYRIFEKMIADGFKMEANTDLRKNKPKKGAWTKLRK